VSVSTPLLQKVTDYKEYTGRTAAIDAVQIRARVSGYLEKIEFKDGDEVKKDKILYQIDPRPYEAALNQATAQVHLQEAHLKYNEAVYQRNVRLQTNGQAVALEDVQLSLSQRDTSRAQVEAAKASAEVARLNLEWTKVTAPIAGILGRTLVTQGNLVIADQTPLTTLVSQDPMWAYFEVDEETMLRARELIREGKLKSVRDKVRIPVSLALANEKGFPHGGYVDFVNNQVTTSTGTLQVRGTFANPKPPVGVRVLSPGLFVRIRIAISPQYDALVVTQGAIGTDQSLKYLYVVDDKNRVVRRDVQLGTQQGQLQVITAGLKANEKVVVDGLQHVMPGAVVTPKTVPMPGSESKTERATEDESEGTH
jgi:RND family efflux transporter MFP subunit